MLDALKLELDEKYFCQKEIARCESR
jgi:hypothetical protein